MTDYEDDWMHPGSGALYSYNPKETEERRRSKPYLIQRKRVIQCTWLGDGPPTKWDEWEAFRTKEERDREITRLRKEHPAWILRARELDALGRIRERGDWP